MASSAPVLAKFNFFEYLEVVQRSLNTSKTGMLYQPGIILTTVVYTAKWHFSHCNVQRSKDCHIDHTVTAYVTHSACDNPNLVELLL